MEFEKWIPWVIPLLLIFGPIFFKWWRKREAKDPAIIPNEAPVKWRKLDKSQNIRPFSGWTISKTSTFRITSDGIYCNGTAIPVNRIGKAIVYSLKDHPFGKGLSSVLRVETDDDIYDFSISPYRLEKIELPFSVNEEEAEIIPKLYSRLMIIAFIVIVIAVILVKSL